MSEIKLNRRYPESRLEDVTDAYMRGFEFDRAMRTDENDALRKERGALDRLTDVLNETNDGLLAENEKLRELVAELYQCSRQVGCDHCGDGYRSICSVLNRMRELGVEV